MKVKEIMTGEAVTCTPETDLATAAQLMWEGDCGVLPVVSEGKGVVGMITDRDICMATAMKFRSPSGVIMFTSCRACVVSQRTAVPSSSIPGSRASFRSRFFTCLAFASCVGARTSWSSADGCLIWQAHQSWILRSRHNDYHEGRNTG